MIYKNLGHSNIKVSTICLGTMTWGEQNSQEEAFQQMDLAFDYGVNFFDTAELYPIPPSARTQGETSRIISRWIQSKKNRDKIIIADKIVGRSNMEWFRNNGEMTRLNKNQIKFALERFNCINSKKNKKFLLIGNMLELGKYSKKLHIKIAEYINNSKVNKTYVYGNYTKHTFNKLKPQIRGRILKNNNDIMNLIDKDLPNNSFLMIKGSNATGLNKLIKNL